MMKLEEQLEIIKRGAVEIIPEEELVNKHGVNVMVIARDLSQLDAPREVYEEVKESGLPVDYLINNAGFGSLGDFADLDLEKELEMVGLNVMALVALTHRYIQRMRANKSGTIINVSSTASFQPLPYMASYAATKAFVTSFSEAIAEEVAFLEQNWPTGLAAGIIHADLFPDNVFFLGDGLSGLIDFYFACNDMFAYDIAICLNAWCF